MRAKTGGTSGLAPPPIFWFTSAKNARAALQKLLNDRQQVQALWAEMNTSGEALADEWERYVDAWLTTDIPFRFNIEESIRVMENPIAALL
jgi:hypothetical protein